MTEFSRFSRPFYIGDTPGPVRFRSALPGARLDMSGDGVSIGL